MEVLWLGVFFGSLVGWFVSLFILVSFCCCWVMLFKKAYVSTYSWNCKESLIYRVGQKKVNPKCSTHNFVKYWPIIKIHSLYNLQKICNATSIKYPTTPQMRRYTTLWNVLLAIESAVYIHTQRVYRPAQWGWHCFP